jgi:hypothetical protein
VAENHTEHDLTGICEATAGRRAISVALCRAKIVLSLIAAMRGRFRSWYFHAIAERRFSVLEQHGKRRFYSTGDIFLFDPAASSLAGINSGKALLPGPTRCLPTAP